MTPLALSQGRLAIKFYLRFTYSARSLNEGQSRAVLLLLFIAHSDNALFRILVGRAATDRTTNTLHCRLVSAASVSLSLSLGHPP